MPTKSYLLPTQTKPATVFDPCAVGIINELLNADPSIQIVVSSTWGKHGRERIVELFNQNGIDPLRLHDDWITPRRQSHVRTEQIRQWLDNHPEVTEWCAIDDEMLDSVVLPNFVQCDGANGLSWRNYIECRYYLGLTNPDGPGKYEDCRARHLAVIENRKYYEMLHMVRRGEPYFDQVTEMAVQLFRSPQNNKTLED